MLYDGPTRFHNETGRIAPLPRLTIGFSLSQKRASRLSIDFHQALATSQPQIAKIQGQLKL